jgi:hypothetical protein
MGFVVDKVALGHAFSEYFGFVCHCFHRLNGTYQPGQLQKDSSVLSNSGLGSTPREKQKVWGLDLVLEVEYPYKSLSKK